MSIRLAEISDLPTLLEIYNYYVKNSTATFDEVEKTMEQWQSWYEIHQKGTNCLYVYDIGGKACGYITLSPYRDKDAFAKTAELSVYVSPDMQHRSIASSLMEFVLNKVRSDGKLHAVISVITSSNGASVRLHEKFGFSFCGTIPSVGCKNGVFLGIDNYIKLF